ncbi:hypothetical protein [Paractinoplanes hotanensis]|nr:hypothetical protein [Actinoplanes hotanensis]
MSATLGIESDRGARVQALRAACYRVYAINRMSAVGAGRTDGQDG